MGTIRMKINGFEFPVREDATILEASREAYGAKQWDIYIPTLQYLKGVQEEDNSGLCVVAVTGVDGLVNASTTKVEDGMEVFTRTDEVMGAKIGAYMQIVSTHDRDCKNCFRTGNCELQAIAPLLWLPAEPASDKNKIYPIDKESIIVRDENKCIKCGRCVAACKVHQGIEAIVMEDNRVVPSGAATLADTNCVNCGQCIAACPVGALRERSDIDKVKEALADPDKFVVIQTAPSLRAGIGEIYEFPVGSETEGRLVAAVRALGFDKVYDTTFAADLTIIEEATELLDRMDNGGVLPMMTSCCPAWVKYCEQEYPELLPNVSTCKSPQQMFGATIKGYLSAKEGIAIDKIVVVSAMPCVAKKFEITRDDMTGAGVPDVDYSITTRELGEMMKAADIKFDALADEAFDSPLGKGSGAGMIFGVSGGVAEAAGRTIADWDPDKEVKTISVNGLAKAKELLEKITAGEADYDLIEVMACPGGCVNGGGQKQQVADIHMAVCVPCERGSVLRGIDEKGEIRKSHENPEIKAIYAKVLDEPGSELAHTLLHTTYKAR